jgi:uncharacterized protein YdaU (DUF1376 family)
MNSHQPNVPSHSAQVSHNGFSTKRIGHNSATYGQELRADLEHLLNEDSEKLFIFAQWHINDYIAGTQGMTLEHEGAYQRFLMKLYSKGKPLPDDDSFMARMMALSTRVWKRVKDALIAAGKIIVRAGCLTNSRFEKERIKRAEQLRKRSFAAQCRWENEREKPVPAEPVSAKFAGSLPEVSGKFCENQAEKVNEIKGSQDACAYANHKPISKSNTTLIRAREDMELIRKRLLEAGGSAINEAYPGFLSLAEPIRWLDNGCDLEADIVPAIKRAIASKRTGKIMAWSYFSAAVQEARDQRLLPMEVPKTNGFRHSKPQWVVEREEQKAVIDSYDWS